MTKQSKIDPYTEKNLHNKPIIIEGYTVIEKYSNEKTFEECLRNVIRHHLKVCNHS